LTHANLLAPDFEGSFDNKTIKFRIVALAVEGKGAVQKFGDESDFDVEDGIGFPPIPPILSASRLPQLTCNNKLLKLWHLQDRVFKRPIAELRLCLYCAEANKTPVHSACADLLVRLVLDVMTETTYMASMCELGTSFYVNDSGFTLRVHGFDDKLLSLFLIIFELLLSFRGHHDKPEELALPNEIESRRFDLCLETYRRQCINGGMQASKLVSDSRVRCLRPTLWSSNEKLKAILDMDISKFMKTISQVLDKIGAEGLYHGNIDKSDATRVQNEIIGLMNASSGSAVGLARKKYPRQHVFQVPTCSTVVSCGAKDPMDSNRAVEVYFQVGKDNILDRVIADLIAEMMYEPLYDQIRTKDQFGYQVSCDTRWTDGVIGYQIQVVSSSKTVKEIDDRIEAFLLEFRQHLEEMSTGDFLEHLASLAKHKLDMFNSLSDETGHYWSEIRNGRYLFQVEREEVLCLKGISQSQVLNAYDKWIYPGEKNGKANRRRRLSVQVMGCEALSSFFDSASPKGIEDFNDARIKEFHKQCKNQTFGKIY
jgi:nardilysin